MVCLTLAWLAFFSLLLVSVQTTNAVFRLRRTTCKGHPPLLCAVSSYHSYGVLRTVCRAISDRHKVQISPANIFFVHSRRNPYRPCNKSNYTKYECVEQWCTKFVVCTGLLLTRYKVCRSALFVCSFTCETPKHVNLGLPSNPIFCVAFQPCLVCLLGFLTILAQS